MIIGVDRVLPQRTAHKYSCTVGDHLVHVHIVAGSRPRLEWVNHELRSPLVGHHFFPGLDDDIGNFGIKQANIPVDLSGGSFDQRHRPDKCPVGH